MICNRHGDVEVNASNRCKLCESAKVAEHRRRVKRKLVELHGGQCTECGYSKSMAALVFHHKNPDEKAFGIASSGFGRSWASLVTEAKKCVLLCANCHAETHENGRWSMGKTAPC